MGIQYKPFLLATLAVASALATGRASSAPFAWRVSFEGHGAEGAVHGQLSASSSFTRVPEEKVLPDGSRAHTYSFSSFDWVEDWSWATVDIHQGAYRTQDDGLAVMDLVAIRLADGSSRLDIDWTHRPITWSDNYGSSQTIYRSGGLQITSRTDELFAHPFAPWSAVASASGFTKIDTPPYKVCGRFDCWTAPGGTQLMPFTITAISPIPEPGALSLLMGGALAWGTRAVRCRAKAQARAAKA